MVPTLSRDELLRQREQNPALLLVEALPPMMYADSHLPGAVNLPPDQVDTLAPLLLPDTTAAIVVYCSNRACASAPRVAQRLVQLGYSRVAHYHGGKQDWALAGLPFETSAAMAGQ